MRTIEDYLQAGMRQTRSASLRQFARHVGLTVGALTGFRKDRSLPSEITIKKLAELANIPAGEALRDLELWRAERLRLRALRMLQKALQRAAAVGAVVVLIAGGISVLGSSAGTAGEQINPPCRPLYIMRILWRRFFRKPRMLAPV